MGSGANSIDISRLSDEQRELVECIGIESYCRLTMQYGGSSIYVARPDSIDKQKRNRLIAEEFGKGASYKELAVKYGLTVVWVRKILEGSA